MFGNPVHLCSSVFKLSSKIFHPLDIFWRIHAYAFVCHFLRPDLDPFSNARNCSNFSRFRAATREISPAAAASRADNRKCREMLQKANAANCSLEHWRPRADTESCASKNIRATAALTTNFHDVRIVGGL